MKNGLLINALTRLLLGVAILCATIFGAAGSLHYWNGWVLIIALFVPMSIVGAVLLIKEPDLLRKRLNVKERDVKQSVVVKASGLLFILAFVLSGLGWRFGWYMLPRWVVAIGLVLFLLAYLMYAEVLARIVIYRAPSRLRRSRGLSTQGYTPLCATRCIAQRLCYLSQCQWFLVHPLQQP